MILRSRRVVVDGRVAPASIHVSGETIARIAAFDDVPDGEPILDFADDVIMPGLVDSHVHVNEPGRTEWEGFATATRAAAAGGVTTIIDMPLNSIPATTTVEALLVKADTLAGKCWTDVGLWGGAVPGNEHELRPMLDRGALGFKCFLIDSGVAEFGHLDEAGVRRALTTLAGTGAPLLAHAELAGPIDAARVQLPDSPRAYETYLASRPAQAEDEAIELLARLCDDVRSPIHVVHLSSASAIDIIREARERDLPFTTETTPHYLCLHAESIKDGATEFKCAPPIRQLENREKLWHALQEGLITLVVSDHSPCTPELKCRDSGDFGQAWGGIASLQLSLPVVWSEAHRRGFEISDLVSWMCQGPARLSRLDYRKGRLAPGFDADLCIWSPETAFEVTPEMIHHRHTLTPYLGQSLQGVVKTTYLRGTAVYENGSFGRPIGEWIRR